MHITINVHGSVLISTASEPQPNQPGEFIPGTLETGAAPIPAGQEELELRLDSLQSVKIGLEEALARKNALLIDCEERLAAATKRMADWRTRAHRAMALCSWVEPYAAAPLRHPPAGWSNELLQLRADWPRQDESDAAAIAGGQG